MRLDHLLSREKRVTEMLLNFQGRYDHESDRKIKGFKKEAEPEEDRQIAGESQKKSLIVASKIVSVSF